jgi:hypothetical protein
MTTINHLSIVRHHRLYSIAGVVLEPNALVVCRFSLCVVGIVIFHEFHRCKIKLNFFVNFIVFALTFWRPAAVP